MRMLNVRKCNDTRHLRTFNIILAIIQHAYFRQAGNLKPFNNFNLYFWQTFPK